MTSITGTIAALTGEDAIRVLADTADTRTGCPTWPSCAPWKPACATPPPTTPDCSATPTRHRHRRRGPGPGHPGAAGRHPPELVPVITRASTTPATLSASLSPSPSARWWSWPRRGR